MCWCRAENSQLYVHFIYMYMSFLAWEYSKKSTEKAFKTAINFFFEIDILKYLHIECTQEIYFKPLSAWHCAYCYMYIYVKVTECDHKHLMHGFIGILDLTLKMCYPLVLSCQIQIMSISSYYLWTFWLISKINSYKRVKRAHQS